MPVQESALHDLPHRPGFLLRRAHQVAVAIFSEEIGRLALTPPQHNVLSAILAHPGCHQSEISKLVGYDRATVGALVAALEGRELITRRSSDADKRVRTLALTAAGKRLLHASDQAMGRISERIVAPLAPYERELFIALLGKVALVSLPTDATGSASKKP